MINGKLDISVPKVCVINLWEVPGRHPIKLFWTGPYGLYLHKNEVLNHAIHFFKRELNNHI